MTGSSKTMGEKIRESLPHLYGWPWYAWAWAFFKSTNTMNLLCAANQISKSSTQIRKAIEWSTNTKLWPKLWPRNPTPRNMWYLYPDSKVATVEFESKWVPEFMPRGVFKDHPVYGWTAVYDKKRIEKIVWNNGCVLHMKTYMQNPQSLQSSTVHAIFCFVKGTEILTRTGVRCISTIKPGDEVMSHRGWRRVKSCPRVGSREVVTREFSNGQKLTGTPDHPVWTHGDGWVGLGQLTPEHVCYSVPEWKMSLIKKLFCLRTAFIRVSQRVKTNASEIISGVGRIAGYISPFGNLEMASVPRVMSSTTRTITPSTINLRTYNSCQKRIIPHTTNLKSGSPKNITTSIASDVENVLSLDHLSGLSRGIATKTAGAIGRHASALFAKTISWLVRTYKPVHVLTPVDTNYQRKPVYNLNVEDAHTYFSQSLLVHNCDEELPEHIYDELQFRLAGTDGYFHMVFTATLNQQLWWKAMEGKDEQEKFPEAFKQQISMYDCQTYRNGKPGAFNKDRIAKLIAKCKSENEVKRRVYGRFIADTGRKYPAFDPSRHFVQPFHLDPGKWHFYGGVDPGGGGAGHPSGMGIIAVAPNMRKAYVCRGLRMDGQDTTSGDTLNAYREMRGNLAMRNQFYDQASKDFFMVASRAGESFSQSQKSHELGEDIVNTLFKNDMLFIFDTSELRKLGQELVTLRTDVVKRKAQDDFIDGAVRYICTSIPWDWSMLTGTPEVKPVEDRPFTQKEYDEWVEEERRGTVDEDRERRRSGKGKEWKEWESEVKEWNDAYGN